MKLGPEGQALKAASRLLFSSLKVCLKFHGKFEIKSKQSTEACEAKSDFRMSNAISAHTWHI